MPGITNPAEPFFKDGIWGWIDDAWHKLPMVWGISEGYSQQVYIAAASAPNDDASGTPVGAGEVLVVEAITCTDRDKITTYNLMSAVVGGITLSLAEGVQPAVDRFLFWSGRLTLTQGDYVQANFVGVDDDDRLILRYSGYKMKIAE